MSKISAGVTLALITGLSAAAHAGGYTGGYTIPNFSGSSVSEPGIGFAAIDSSASLTSLGAGSYKFTISSSTANTGALNFGPYSGSGAVGTANGGSAAVTNEQVSLTANLQKVGGGYQVTGGTYSITGTVAGVSGSNLFSANLTAGALDAVTSGGTDYIAFATNGLAGSAYSAYGSNSPSESLYLYASGNTESTGLGTGPGISTSSSNSAWNALVAALSTGGTLSNISVSNLGSYATVPLPLPVGLLLSGLAGLGLLGRRKSVTAA